MNRSENMRRITAKNTKPELRLRKHLYSLGLRYRCHVNTLPGKPDLVFSRARLAVFVHGCFWHQHEDCIEASNPHTNRRYWIPKLRRNVERDAEHAVALRRLKYRVVVCWECEVLARLERVSIRIVSALEVGQKRAVNRTQQKKLRTRVR